MHGKAAVVEIACIEPAIAEGLVQRELRSGGVVHAAVYEKAVVAVLVGFARGLGNFGSGLLRAGPSGFFSGRERRSGWHRGMAEALLPGP